LVHAELPFQGSTTTNGRENVLIFTGEDVKPTATISIHKNSVNGSVEGLIDLPINVYNNVCNNVYNNTENSRPLTVSAELIV